MDLQGTRPEDGNTPSEYHRCGLVEPDGAARPGVAMGMIRGVARHEGRCGMTRLEEAAQLIFVTCEVCRADPVGAIAKVSRTARPERRPRAVIMQRWPSLSSVPELLRETPRIWHVLVSMRRQEPRRVVALVTVRAKRPDTGHISFLSCTDYSSLRRKQAGRERERDGSQPLCCFRSQTPHRARVDRGRCHQRTGKTLVQFPLREGPAEEQAGNQGRLHVVDGIHAGLADHQTPSGAAALPNLSG